MIVLSKLPAIEVHKEIILRAKTIQRQMPEGKSDNAEDLREYLE